MNKLYPKLTYTEEIKAYYLEDLPRTPVKTLVTIYKNYMGHYKLKDMISASKAQVLYIYGEKELNCVKASAKLFQQLHPNTILYELRRITTAIYQLTCLKSGLSWLFYFWRITIDYTLLI